MYYQAKPKKKFQVLENENELFSHNPIFFHRSRDAIYFYLNQLEKKNLITQKIWLPAFICDSIVATIKETNYDLNFYDVGPDLSPCLENIKFFKNDIIILVNFFGFNTISAIDKNFFFKTGVKVIIDNAHMIPQNFTNSDKFCNAKVYGLWKNLPITDGCLFFSDLNSELKKNFSFKKRTSFIRSIKFLLDLLAYKLNINILFFKDLLKKKNDLNLKSYVPSKYVINNYTLKKIKKYNFDKANKKRIINFNRFNELVYDFNYIDSPFKKIPALSSPMVFPIKSDKVNILEKKMRNAGVECYRWPGFEFSKSIELKNFPFSNDWFNKILLIPINQDLEENDLVVISEKLKKILKEIYGNN